MMNRQEIFAASEELERKLSHINAKVANAADLYFLAQLRERLTQYG